VDECEIKNFILTEPDILISTTIAKLIHTHGETLLLLIVISILIKEPSSNIAFDQYM
jgi:hypothetical protein